MLLQQASDLLHRLPVVNRGNVAAFGAQDLSHEHVP